MSIMDMMASVRLKRTCLAKFAYNNAKHSVTRYTTFQLDCGQNPFDSLHMFRVAVSIHTYAIQKEDALKDILCKFFHKAADS